MVLADALAPSGSPRSLRRCSAIGSVDGPRRPPEDQLLLGFEEVEQTTASDEANKEATSAAERESRAAKRWTNRGFLPSHLPRVEIVIDIEDHRCPC
jgi:hypothetical protein